MCSWATHDLQKQEPVCLNICPVWPTSFMQNFIEKKISPGLEIVAVQWLIYPCSIHLSVWPLSWELPIVVAKAHQMQHLLFLATL